MLLADQIFQEPTKARMYAEIFEAIADRRFCPGNKIPEGEVAAFYGVTRTPLREVMGALSAQGLVTLRPGHGAFVASPTPEQTAAKRAIAGLFAAHAAAQFTRKLTTSSHRAAAIADWTRLLQLIGEDQTDIAVALFGHLISAMAEQAIGPSAGAQTRIAIVVADLGLRGHTNDLRLIPLAEDMRRAIDMRTAEAAGAAVNTYYATVGRAESRRHAKPNVSQLAGAVSRRNARSNASTLLASPPLPYNRRSDIAPRPTS